MKKVSLFFTSLAMVAFVACNSGESTEDAAEDTMENVEETADEAADAAEETMEDAEETMDETMENAEEAMNEGEEAMEETMENAEEKMKETVSGFFKKNKKPCMTQGFFVMLIFDDNS
jgi:F0F1-type ATP synthase membrane subunit b/b'